MKTTKIRDVIKGKEVHVNGNPDGITIIMGGELMDHGGGYWTLKNPHGIVQFRSRDIKSVTPTDIGVVLHIRK